jgi:hypothetical protein
MLFGKLFAALVTLGGLLASVSSNVFGQLLVREETLAAIAARKAKKMNIVNITVKYCVFCIDV